MKRLHRLLTRMTLGFPFVLMAPTCGPDDGGGDVVADAVTPTDTDLTDGTTSACEGATPNGACEGAASCDIGQECCCGRCYPSLRCACSGGAWSCYYTDACMIPSCSDTVDGDATSACESATTALAEALYGRPQGFSVIVRLAHDTRAVLSYAVLVGPHAHPDEAAARATAQRVTGFGDGAQSLAGLAPTDNFVFYQPPGDFGGVGVVSAHTGLAVFGGSIVWAGTGAITYPASWSPPSELASGCPASGGLGTTRGFDLVTGTAMSAADVKAATDVILDTAVPGAIWHGGYAFDAMVLRYPRTVGALDPSTAEWIVIVSGGWLE